MEYAINNTENKSKGKRTKTNFLIFKGFDPRFKSNLKSFL